MLGLLIDVGLIFTCTFGATYVVLSSAVLDTLDDI